MGMTDLTLGTPLDGQQKEYLALVKSSSEQLLGLINDILDLSKIEAGKVELEQAAFRLRPSLEETIRLQASRARDKGLDLIFQVDPAVPDSLVGDLARLRQVMLNLVGNAIKFTEEGEIVVRVDPAKESSGRQAVLKVTVADSGIGIDPEKASQIFEPFSQADASTTRKYGGTGLGLTISRQLVEMMGGRIWLESSPGRGSIFAFTVRLGLGAQSSAQPGQEEPSGTAAGASPGQEQPRDLSILLAEDNLVNQKLATILLEKRGHRVTLAHNGREALAELERQAFDVVLMDVEMPEMDGVEATSRIRKREREQGSRVPVVALTAHALKGDRERFLAAGMDDYLTKPLDPAKLFHTVEAWGRRAG
jgi:CheY-like chemotaxis protein